MTDGVIGNFQTPGRVIPKRVPAPSKHEAKIEPILTAVGALMMAEKDLEKAKADVPSYTGPWSDVDYYTTEQHIRNKAVDNLYVALCGVVRDIVENASEPTPVGIDEDSPFIEFMNREIATYLTVRNCPERDQQLLAGCVYVGDLITKIETFGVMPTKTTLATLGDIPNPRGTEVWCRPNK